jgi:hypothetical protein
MVVGADPFRAVSMPVNPPPSPPPNPQGKTSPPWPLWILGATLLLLLGLAYLYGVQPEVLG